GDVCRRRPTYARCWRRKRRRSRRATIRFRRSGSYHCWQGSRCGDLHAAAVSELALLDRTDRRWSDYLDASPELSPFHTEWWSGFLSACYGFPTVAAVVLDRDRVRAGLPVAIVRRHRWVALPFTDSCAPLGDARTLGRLLESGRGRTTIDVHGELPGADARCVAFNHSLALAPDPAVVYAKFHR